MSGTSPRERRRMIHIAHESSFAVDPDSDGSDYLYVPAEGISYTEGTEILTTAYSTGRNYATESEVGADGGEVTFSTPLLGLSSAAGAGVNASTVTADWLDRLLEATFGVAATTAGIAATGGSTTTFTAATSVGAAQDLEALFTSATPSGAPRTLWTQLQSITGAGPYTYNLAPTLAAAATSSTVSYGIKRYSDDDNGGPTLACVVTDDSLVYTYLGGRVTRCRITAQAKQRVMVEWTIAFDRRSLDASKMSLPSAAVMPYTPIKLMRSPVIFNGSAIPTRMIEIDFGLSASEVSDTAGVNGRGAHELISIAPTVTIEPLRADSHDQLKRALTRGALVAQLGAGVLESSRLNTCALHLARCEAREVSYTADNGITRNRIVFTAVDPIEFSAGVASRFMSFARA